MAGKNAGKSKRQQSDHKKASRVGCRKRAAQAHEALGRQQELQHGHNIKLIRDGELTPWQQAEAKRAADRLVTCGKCRVLFEDGKCPQCTGTLNLRGAWEKRSAA